MKIARFMGWVVLVVVVFFVVALRCVSRATGLMGGFTPRL